MAERNSELQYIYRDGSNYKNQGSVVFEGKVTPQLRRRLITALHEEEYFIAGQIRVPEVFFSGVDEDSHCFHEFVSLEVVKSKPNDSEKRTITQFVEEVEAANKAGWKEFDPCSRALENPSDTPRLSKEDWAEIYYALESKLNAVKVGSYGGSDRDLKIKDWVDHLTRIIETIGPEGSNMITSEGEIYG